ncbi:unnamed protein product [Meloidogyne enterolobii]|uniref:Uncharacterized protein n=1 Tax=Meloidogyne enterolobii TaxID=390850 RepID=A0ACB1AC18_MELEN
MSASFLVVGGGNSFATTSHQNNGLTVTSFLNFNSQTWIVILPICLAITFFCWLFFQKGYLAVTLVFTQLLVIIILGILTYLILIFIKKCWRRLKLILFSNSKSKDELIDESTKNQENNLNQAPSEI